MKRIRKRDILTGIIANIAIINLVLLFGFEYEVFGFSWAEFYTRKFSNESAVTASTADTAEQTAQATTGEQVAAAAVDEVEVQRVPRVEPAHQRRELVERLTNEQVNMVVHEAPCKESPR